MSSHYGTFIRSLMTVMAGKKRKVCDLDNDDEELFTYGNQIPLTFSVPTKTAAVVLSDSSSDEDSDNEHSWERNEHDDHDEVLNLDDEADDSDDEVACIDEDNDNDVLDLNESQGSRRSPSPPPPVPEAAMIRLQMQMQKKKSAREFDQTFDALKQAFVADESPVLTRTANRSSSSVICITDTFSPLSDTERHINIKVRTSAGIKRFDIGAKETFVRIFQELSKCLGVPEENLLLSLRETNIQKDNTPIQVGATVADIIECVTMKTKELNPDDDESAITIKLHGGSAATSTSFKVFKDKPLQTLIDRYCEFRKLPHLKLKFLFDGDVIRGTETPDGLDMDDDNIIDVRTL